MGGKCSNIEFCIQSSFHFPPFSCIFKIFKGKHCFAAPPPLFYGEKLLRFETIAFILQRRQYVSLAVLCVFIVYIQEKTWYGPFGESDEEEKTDEEDARVIKVTEDDDDDDGEDQQDVGVINVAPLKHKLNSTHFFAREIQAAIIIIIIWPLQ